MSDNVFETNAETTTQSNFVEQLVGEGKKFATVEDLAKGKAEGDRYIDQLKVELEQAKTKAQEVDALNQKVDELLKSIPTQTTTTSSSTVENTTSQNTVSEDDIQALVKATLEKQESDQRATKNIDLVSTKLRETYGDKAGEVVEQRARELGMTVAQVEEMAKNAPAAALELFSGGAKTTETNPLNQLNTKQNSAATPTTSGNERGWSHYRELRKSGQLYKPQVWSQMMQDIEKVGKDKFYSS